MNRKEFIEGHGAACANWNWSWSFVNHGERFVIFGAWDKDTDGGTSLILEQSWSHNEAGRKRPGYTQAQRHLRLIEEEGYALKTFPIVHSAERKNKRGEGPSKISTFVPELTPKVLKRVGSKWYALDWKGSGVSTKRTSSPPLTEEELILVLDTYFQIGPNGISQDHPRVQALSRLLKQLPIHPPGRRPTKLEFRSPDGVRGRISQFHRIAEGINSREPKVYLRVWRQFADDRVNLEAEALRIRQKYHAVGLIDGELVAQDIGESNDPYADEPRGTKQPRRTEQKVVRIIRDTALAKAVKKSRDYRCQLCSERLELQGGPYAEAHHVQPLGQPHNGPDVRENIVCVCPNCHVKLDFGAIRLDGSTLDGVAKKYIRYHNQKIAAD